MESTADSVKNKMKIAICYWGLTRSTKYVYKSHDLFLKKILQNNNIDYDVYFHSWKLDEPSFVQLEKTSIPIDYGEYILLDPYKYLLESQSEFWKSVNFNEYFYKDVWDTFGHGVTYEWYPQLIKNHLCALESQKRVTKLMLESGQTYDYVMYIRPDVELKSEFPCGVLSNLCDNDIVILSYGWHEGYNDTFAIMKPNKCINYAYRIDEIKDYRKNEGRIVSEKFVKYIIDKYFERKILIDFKQEVVRPR
jgi:hypothetical protein